MKTRTFTVLLLALAATACDIKVGEKGGLSFDIAEGKATDEWTRTYTVAPGGTFEIVNRIGDIKVSPAKGAAIEVTALRTLRSGSFEESQASLKTTQMIEEVAPDRVHIQTPERPDGQKEGPFGRSFMWVEYRVGLPDGLVMRLKTENGQVTVENVQGPITASTTNGGLTFNGVSGPLDAQTVNGGVNVELKTLAGDVKLGAVNGGVRVRVVKTIDANLELSAVNGGVSVEDTLTLATSVKERQKLSGRLNKGGPTITATVVNGGVRVSSKADD
jgi:ribosomal protein S28E/S33